MALNFNVVVPCFHVDKSGASISNGVSDVVRRVLLANKDVAKMVCKLFLK